jgi:hypothetical protein
MQTPSKSATIVLQARVLQAQLDTQLHFKQTLKNVDAFLAKANPLLDTLGAFFSTKKEPAKFDPYDNDFEKLLKNDEFEKLLKREHR